MKERNFFMGCNGIYYSSLLGSLWVKAFKDINEEYVVLSVLFVVELMALFLVALLEYVRDKKNLKPLYIKMLICNSAAFFIPYMLYDLTGLYMLCMILLIMLLFLSTSSIYGMYHTEQALSVYQTIMAINPDKGQDNADYMKLKKIRTRLMVIAYLNIFYMLAEIQMVLCYVVEYAILAILLTQYIFTRKRFGNGRRNTVRMLGTVMAFAAIHAVYAILCYRNIGGIFIFLLFALSFVPFHEDINQIYHTL